MARRVIGQDRLAFSLERSRPQSTFDRPLHLNDWTPLEQQLLEISGAAKGEPASPSSVLFKVLLIAGRQDLSDVRLTEAIHDRATFRRFRGFSVYEPTPEWTAVVRLRAQLVAHNLDHALSDEVMRPQRRAVQGTAKLLRVAMMLS